VELRDRLKAHLAHEERDAMALVQAHLTQEDWERLDKEHFAPMYSPGEIPAVMAWVRHGLPAHAARKLFPTRSFWLPPACWRGASPAPNAARSAGPCPEPSVTFRQDRH
jgi:hypothetical protein